MKQAKLIFKLLIVISLITGCGMNDDTVVNENMTEVNHAVNGENEGGQVQDRFENIEEFELEIVLQNNDELEFDYKVRGGNQTAEIEREDGGNREEISGEEALKEIETIFNNVTLEPGMDPNEAINSILSFLSISEEDVRSLELEVDFTTGEKLEGRI